MRLSENNQAPFSRKAKWGSVFNYIIELNSYCFKSEENTKDVFFESVSWYLSGC